MKYNHLAMLEEQSEDTFPSAIIFYDWFRRWSWLKSAWQPFWEDGHQRLSESDTGKLGKCAVRCSEWSERGITLTRFRDSTCYQHIIGLLSVVDNRKSQVPSPLFF